MVHRIQNRNPEHYDASTIQKNNIHSNTNSFISSTSGANALQVENEQFKELKMNYLILW